MNTLSNSDRRNLANAIRFLSIDAVQQANSGHPGMPMGMADIAQVLWHDYLNHNPSNPAWVNRDRFVLSNGHGSMLLYSLLNLSGYDLPIEELKNFRQLHSKTPGHPEYGYAPGIETTTGPLGQGLANAVGMAMAEKTLAAHYNKDAHAIVDHYSYAFIGDGCLMEGISHEVCSLAGTLKLGKLIVFYDDNGISIDGKVQGWFSDDTVKRFEAYNWQVIADVDGHDPDSIKKAIDSAKSNNTQPTLICCKTIIGWGSPHKAGSEKSHGAPLGDDEIKLVREKLNWPHAPFVIPEEVKTAWNATAKGQASESVWQQKFAAYKNEYPELAAEFEQRMSGQMIDQWSEKAAAIVAKLATMDDKIATRKASQICLDEFGAIMPELIGGSADLAGSNLTIHKSSRDISADNADGNYIYYGVREFGMFAINNGIRLHGGFVPYGGTFLMFSEYARNALRMAALMKVQSIAVLTHDSIGLGEDGPTHQPVEQIATLRLMPNMSVWRPADLTETAVAWRYALERQDGPTSLCLSRQGVPAYSRSDEQIANIARGAYIIADSKGTPDIIIMASGTELSLAMQAKEELSKSSIDARVVSMPAMDVFEKQSDEYKESVLPAHVTKRIAIEAGVSATWFRYVHDPKAIFGVDTFGESAPAEELYALFNLTTQAIVAKAQAMS